MSRTYRWSRAWDCPYHDYRNVLRVVGRREWMNRIESSYRCDNCARTRRRRQWVHDGKQRPTRFMAAGPGLRREKMQQRRQRRHGERIDLVKDSDTGPGRVNRPWLD